MRRRLIVSTALIALAAVIVLGVPLGAVEAERLRQDALARLEREADGAAGAIDDRVERHAAIAPALLRGFASAGHRIAVTTSDGRHVASGPPLTGGRLRADAGSAFGGSVVAEAPAGELAQRVHREWLLIVALSLGGVLTAVALAALQAHRLARPLEAIARRSAKLGEGDFSVRVGQFGVPEIDAIAGALDASAGRIAGLVAREREFSANVSHQLRTPLTALQLRIEAAIEAADSEAGRAELAAALTESVRLEVTIADLLAYARRTTNRPAIDVDLVTVAHEHVQRWRPMFVRAGRTIDVVAARNVVARASRGTAGQVLDVLLDNALRHGSGPTRVTVRANDDMASLTVADDGPGVAETDRDRIFDRGASHGAGTGIGLHLARALAQADRGSLAIAADRSTRFELRLPVAPLPG